MYSVSSLGAVVCALIVAHKELVRIRHVILGAVALGLAMLLLAFVPGVKTAVVGVFFVGMAGILYMTPSTAIIQIEAKREMHGRLLALQMVVIGGAALLGGPVLGWIADALGARAPMMLGGVVCLLAAFAGHFATRDRSRP